MNTERGLVMPVVKNVNSTGLLELSEVSLFVYCLAALFWVNVFFARSRFIGHVAILFSESLPNQSHPPCTFTFANHYSFLPGRGLCAEERSLKLWRETPNRQVHFQ